MTIGGCRAIHLSDHSQFLCACRSLLQFRGCSGSGHVAHYLTRAEFTGLLRAASSWQFEVTRNRRNDAAVYMAAIQRIAEALLHIVDTSLACIARIDR